MPGKESDFPSRKQRKVIGKKNVRGRMAGHLPLYEITNNARVAEPAAEAQENDTTPKIDKTTFDERYVTQFME